jgi:protein TonB
LLSIAAHLALLFFLFSGVDRSAKIVPYRLPGTDKGISLLTYYSPGSRQRVESKAPSKNPEKPRPAPALKPAPAAAQPELAKAAQSEAGVGASAQSGLGEGDITIALQSYFPFPRPDLSALPHGTKGDVILNAVIDEHGNITELTLLKGLGSPVDETVIATVQQWHYTPAMRRGVPVTSEQELHFHYERG